MRRENGLTSFGRIAWPISARKARFAVSISAENACSNEKTESPKVGLNTSIASPIPTTLLEAMSCGCAIVSTATCMIPEIIEHGVNGYCSNDVGELRSFLDELLNNEELCERLGRAARKTVEDSLSLGSFVDRWNDIFDNAAFIGERMI